MGISDITVLLNAIYTKTGMITFHGNDIVFGLGKFRTEYNEQEFKDRIIDGKTGIIKHNSEWKCIRE
jgi:muramoyltetrapeptide carboxypeptidase